MQRRRIPRLLPFLTATTLVAAAALLCGCQLIAGMTAMWGKEPTRRIPAEYPEIAGKKVCIVVWAEMDTLFEYPHVQYEISEFVRTAMSPAVKGVNFIPNRSVVDFQRQNADWDRMDPAEIGQRFSADRVLSIELTRYTTREPESPHLYRGRISGNVKVYDAGHTGVEPLYRTEVETVYPPDAPASWGIDDAAVRSATMEAFGNAVAGKFYEREEKK